MQNSLLKRLFKAAKEPATFASGGYFHPKNYTPADVQFESVIPVDVTKYTVTVDTSELDTLPNPVLDHIQKMVDEMLKRHFYTAPAAPIYARCTCRSVLHRPGCPASGMI